MLLVLEMVGLSGNNLFYFRFTAVRGKTFSVLYLPQRIFIFVTCCRVYFTCMSLGSCLDRQLVGMEIFHSLLSMFQLGPVAVGT